MPKPVQSLPLPALQPIDGLKETTQTGLALLSARNILLRPLGGFKGPPTYNRLWATGAAETMQAFYRRQPYYPVTGSTFTVNAGTDVFTLAAHGLTVNDAVQVASTGTLPGGMAALTTYYVKTVPTADTFTLSATLGGSTLNVTTSGTGTNSLGFVVGDTSTRRSTNKTCAYLIARQGKSTLVFYDLVNSQCRGMFYLGDDGSYSSGSYDFTAGTATVTVLAVGMDSTARWYASKMGGKALFLGNGVDDNVVVQIARSATPGKWRKAASNAQPTAPVISLVTPASSSNVQAYWNITSRTSGTTLTFTAKSGLFPGLSGNNKIRVRINNTGTGAALAASLGGQGTTADPYYYAITAGSTTTNSSNNAIVTFVNADTQVLAILTASTASPSATADTGSYGSSSPPLGDPLDNGEGTGTSAGFSSRTVTFYARYWDPGTDSYGYEGVSSAESNELVIPSSANNDIRVLVPVDSTAEGGRFGYIRLYMQFEEAPDAVWLLINPDDPVPNGLTSTFTRYPATDEITLLTPSSWADYDVVRLTTTVTLPTGLSLSTDYYLLPGTAAGRKKLALTADGTAVTLSSSGSGTHTATLTKKCVQVGTQTPFLPAADGGEMFADQNRPLPHTLHAFANDQVWRAGNPANPQRIYASKPATADEVAPEGVSLDDQAFVTVINQSQAGGTNKMTALVASQNRLDCHFPTGVTMIDPADTDQRNITVTGAGAISQTAVTVWEQKGVFILGGDLQLRTQSVEQTGAGFAASVASSEFAALAAARYLRDRVDLSELARKPQRVFIFPNVADQHLYMSLPALDGTLKMFAYDFLTNGIVGEFDYPKIYAAVQMEPDRPEILFADEDGNLMVWDTSAQSDRGDLLATSNAWIPHVIPSVPPDMPAQYDGWGYVDVGSARYYQATTSTLKTGFFDLGSMDRRKALTGLLFRCVKNSRARISVTLRTLDQGETTITAEPAQTYARVEHRLNRFLGRSTSLQLEFNIIGAEQSPWIIRDICGLWLPQGRV